MVFTFINVRGISTVVAHIQARMSRSLKDLTQLESEMMMSKCIRRCYSQNGLSFTSLFPKKNPIMFLFHHCDVNYNEK